MATSIEVIHRVLGVIQHFRVEGYPANPMGVCEMVDDKIRVVGGHPYAYEKLVKVIKANRQAVVDALTYACACGRPYYMTTYWGADLCKECVQRHAQKCQETGTWPPEQKADQ